MEKEDYAKLLKNPKWQRKRLEIMQRDNFECKKCRGSDVELNVHHKEYIKGKNPWEYEDDNLITLCVYCHQEIELLKNSEYIKQFHQKNIPFKDIIIYQDNHSEEGLRITIIVYGNDILLKGYNADNEEVFRWCFGGILVETWTILGIKALGYGRTKR